jgi:hypothetical protein
MGAKAEAAATQAAARTVRNMVDAKNRDAISSKLPFLTRQKLVILKAFRFMVLGTYNKGLFKGVSKKSIFFFILKMAWKNVGGYRFIDS